MISQASPPAPIDWLASMIRGLHPLRWIPCLIGLLASGAIAIAVQWSIGPEPIFSEWWQHPVAQAQALWLTISSESFVKTVFVSCVFLSLNSAVWCLIGGWVARNEFNARLRGCPNAAQMQTELTAKDFLLGWHTPLCWCCQVVLALCLVAIIPALFFGLASRWAGGFGALFVSLLLPVVLVANGSLLLLAVGVPAWPLMPMTLAAECSDAFDALSRSYNYLYDQPIRFTLLTAIAVGIAALPLLAVLYPFAEHLAEWEPAARTTVVLFAAALSASIYWSLQALVYLHLRAVADNIDASVIAVERSPELKKQQAAARAMVARRSGQVVDNAAELEKAEDAPLEEKPKTPAFTEAAREAQKASPEATPDEEISGGPLLRKSLILEFAALIGSWFLTVWLLSRFSGEAMAWLRWGLDDRLVPPAEGIYKVSSLIAGLWGLLWLSLPLWVRSLKSWFARLRAKKTLAARQDRQVST